jgi:hypothetical protein
MTASPHVAYPARNGNDVDATSKAARRALAPLSRAGVTKAAKTIMHKRERRNFRQQLANSRVLV